MNRRIVQMLSSWWLMAGLFVLLGTSYLTFSFGQDAYARWITFLFHTPPGLVLYIALIFNLLAASARVVGKRLRRQMHTPETIRAMDAWTELPAAPHSLSKLARWMRQKGFEPSVKAETVFARAGVWSFLPGTVLRIGFAGLMLSLLVSAHIRETQIATLHPGEETLFFGNPVTCSNIDILLPEDLLQVGEQSSFLLDGALIKLAFRGKTVAVSPAGPTRLNGHYYRLIHLGYAQNLTVKTNGTAVNQVVDLDVLPPGKTHLVSLPGTSVFLTVSLEPDRTINKGLLKGKQFNLKDPCYRIVVQSGEVRKKPAPIVLRQGESVTAENVNITAGKHLLYARVQAVHDPALVWVYASLILTNAGILLMLARFFWYGKELAAVRCGDSIMVGWQEEFFKKWGIQRFYEWKDELAELNEGK